MKTRTPQDVVQLLEREIEGLEFGEPVKLYALQLAANTIQELVEKLKKYEGNEEEK